MEGYSVTEAASILGVPTERVWELLARGVLSGAAEGETGMRVYLQPRPAPAPSHPATGSTHANGGPAEREPERELSPFRELLTEFRNLTERYGQALLALGEARGEVASLRSRVDLLEARMDLRLPMGGGAQPEWPTPAPTPGPMPVPSAVDRREASHDDDGDSGPDEERPSPRRRSPRRATENFAEALARAEDPTKPELPAAADAAAALAALREDAASTTRSADAALPRELPAAEAIPMPEESPVSRSTSGADQEPPPAAVQADAQPQPEPEPEPTPVAEPPEAQAVPEPGARPEQAQPEAEPDLEPAAAADAPEPDREPAPTADATEQPETPPVINWDPERYSVAIDEPDWYAEEEPPAAASSTDEPAGESVEDVGAAEEEPAAEAPSREAEDGADEMEIAGSKAPWAPTAFPGSRELDEALAALDVLAGRTRRPGVEVAEEPRAEPELAARPAPDTSEVASDQPLAWPMADPGASPRPASPPAPRPAPGGAVGSRAPVPGQRLTSTPASRAYRRLRRIFPG